MSGRRFGSILMSILLVLLCLRQSSLAQAHKPSREDVQSVYLFDFAHFVRWPAANGSAFQICIAGRGIDPDTLRRVIASEKVDGRPVVARIVNRPSEIKDCEILFIGQGTEEGTKSLLDASAGKAILTVSDIPDFLRNGGMIQFVLTDNRVRFSIDLASVNRNSLSVSSELLKVAASVSGPLDGGSR